jgi:hypothetical protein
MSEEMLKETVKATIRKASKEISRYRKDFAGNHNTTIETLAGGSVCARIKAVPSASPSPVFSPSFSGCAPQSLLIVAMLVGLLKATQAKAPTPAALAAALSTRWR